ncbi:MAG TPA: amino acid adenylation domain-containing protein [Acidobacteriota bacterium]|nr:amino acid adenylation domain-containing protein [Acidobacteriota bacterium]
MERTLQRSEGATALKNGQAGPAADWGRPIHRIFESRAARHPDAVAVVCGDRSVSYGVLNRRANQLARHLQDRGLQPGDLVALFLERTPALIVSLLAVLKAGASYLPIDSHFPAKRVALTGEKARFILSDQSSAHRLTGLEARVIDLDEEEPRIFKGRAANPRLQVPLNQPAYLMYTSGSSGKPKGTLVSHGNVTRLFQAAFSLYDFQRQGVWTFFHSIAFDFSVWEIFGPLLTGGRLVVVSHWDARTPDELARLIRREGVTVLSQTPSAFRRLVTLGRLTQDRPSDLALRWVVFGGEALYMQPLLEFCPALREAGTRLLNMYGITETTVHVTHRLMDEKDAEENRSLIGPALPHLRVHLLDAHMNPVPAQVAGEIYVAGEGVALGYFQSPSLTAQRFLPSPFGGDLGKRLYRSGDLGRALPGGELEYLGRGDTQVKIRGFRIEPGEVRFCLLGQPGVREAVVRAVEDQAGDKVLAAYIIPSGPELALDELWDSLRQELPEHMLPSFIEVMDEFPLTPNGKIDYKALPAAPDRDRQKRDGFVPPQTWEQEVMADVWSDLLALKSVGINDNFFNLGGDSIKALRVSARLKSLGLDIAIEDLFEFPTISALSRLVSSQKQQDAEDALPAEALWKGSPPTLPEQAVDAYPLTHLQLGMLFHAAESRLDVKPYHNVSLFKIEGRFQEARFRQAVEGLLSAHPVLRTGFEMEAYGLPMQLVYDRVEPPVTVERLPQMPASQQEKAVEDWMEREKSNHFDYARAPLIRFKIMVCSDELFYLGLTEHHSILDGWSVASLLTELFQRYLREGGGSPPQDAYSPADNVFRRYVLLEREALESPRQAQFWSDYLSDYARLRLPLNVGANEQETATGSAVGKKRFPLDDELTQALRSLAREVKVPLKSVLLAAHSAVLGFITNSRDTMTGLIAHGRPEMEGGEAGLGLFLNTLPLRMKHRNVTWKEWLQQTYREERRILPFRRYPLAAMRDPEGGKADLQTAFNYTNFHVYEKLVEDAPLKILETRVHEETDFELFTDFSMLARTEQLDLTLSYSRRRFQPQQIEAIADCYLRCFQWMVEDPSAAICLYPLQSPEALARSLSARTPCQPAWSDLRQLMQRARESSCADRVAVVDGERHVSYRRLWQGVDRLAASLGRLGVGPDVPVAVLLGKSLEWTMAALAAVEAGGAYLPLDPADPAERINYMIENAAAQVVVSDAESAALLSLPGLKVITVQHGDGPRSQPRGPVRPLLPDHLSYLIYTSGSTGRPKGVAMHHRGIANLMSWQQADTPIRGRRIVQFASTGFDVSVQEIFTAVMGANTLVMAPGQTRRDFIRLSGLLAREQVECLFAPDTALKALLAAAHSNGLQLPALRTIIHAGEALVVDEGLRRFMQRGGRLYNHYGPTESHVVTAGRVEPGRGDNGTSPSIGREVDDTAVLILDSWLRPCLRGGIGEIYIDSVNVARGYHASPRLTAERFRPHPRARGVRVFKTGDLACRDQQGDIWFLGRADSQVKVRGYRIELEEVRHAFMRHPSVEDAVVSLRRSSGEKRLCVHVLGGGEVDVKALRQFAGSELPPYMVPAHIVPVDSIPMTRNGKIHYAALPPPEASVQSPARPYSPRDEVEKRVLDLWSEVLEGVAEIGPESDFFELGGDSLTLLRLQLKIQSRFALQMSIPKLVMNSSLHKMSRLIGQMMKRNDAGGETHEEKRV